MKPVRVALCVTELDPGGAEKQLVLLVKHLDRHAWTPIVYCLGPRGILADELEQAQVTVRVLGGQGARSAWRVYRQLAQAFQDDQIELVQTFLFHANLLGRLAARRAGLRAVCSGLRVAERSQFWHGWLDRATAGLVREHICVSEGVRRWAIENVGLPREATTVIPNAVDASRFRQALPVDLNDWEVPSDAPVVLCIGRLTPQKAPELLVEAWRLLSAQHPEARCVLLGDGPQRIELQRRIDSLGLGRQIKLVGRQPDVAPWLARATLLALPSRWEGMPNVVLEAMAAGRAVVATDVEGVRELVQPGSTGTIVPVGDPGALATAIGSFLGDPALAAAFGKHAQQIATKRFTPSSTAAQYGAVWSRVLETALRRTT